MSNLFKFTIVAHANRRFLGPYDEKTLYEFLPPSAGFVLDIGCGKGAALAAVGGQGIGIEHNPSFAAEARINNPHAQIWEEDAKTCLQRVPPVDTILCLGASQAIGAPAEAAATLASMLKPGGLLLFGDGCWRRPPDEDYLAFLEAEESDMRRFEDLPSLAPDLEVVKSRQSTFEEWAAYEDSYHATVMDWCRANPNDPDAPAFEARITGWRDAYLKWGRETLGFGMVLWRKPG